MIQMTQMTQPRAEVSMTSQIPTMKIPAMKIPAMKIPDLIKNLRTIVAAGPIGSGEIAEIQNLVRSSLADMRAIGLDTKHDGPGRYLLYKDQDFGFVIMMLVWGQGDKTPIHDHGTWGVEAVLKNTIAVTSYTQCDVDPEEIAQIILPEDSVVFVLPPEFDRHVVEHHAGDQAISIHVYGKELLSARCFVPGDGFIDQPLTAKALPLDI